MPRFKLLNGEKIQFTAEEEAARDNEETIYANKAFDRAIADLRTKRNKLLQDTDFHGMSDNTMSADMTTYRQELRDITSGITTVEEVNDVVFPTKP